MKPLLNKYQLKKLPVFEDEPHSRGAVYFVYYGNYILYIGVTKCLSQRVSQHKPWINGFTVRYISQHPGTNLRRLEYLYIKKYRPPFNNGGGLVTLIELLEQKQHSKE